MTAFYRALSALFLVFLLSFSQFANGQIKDPVKFSLAVRPLSGGVYEATLSASIEPGWHIYSKDLPADSGIPTKMVLSASQPITLQGGIKETGTKHDEFSQAFGARIVYYSDKAAFSQRFKLNNPGADTQVTAEITYQTCDDKVCLAPNTLEFSQKIAGLSLEPSAGTAKPALTTDSVATVPPPAHPATAPGITSAEHLQPTPQTDPKQLKISSLNYQKPLSDCIKAEQKEQNFWGILLLGFGSGLLALLTPCVYPMIPLTVSFFIKGQKNRRKGITDALLYGFFIFAIFTLLSLPFHLIDGISGNILNEISTNIWLNLLFFVVFFALALSFFGYFDLTLPNSWINRTSKAEETGGLLGIFFMALTLVLVSFSCTGPILGGTLGSVISGGQNVATILTFALAGFGLAWALVFGLLALFPQALQSLPKSGGWMTTVKVVLGFVELALALKFLSKADLVSKTFLLKRELFIAIWIVLAIALALYLFGLIRFRHEDRKPRISLTRKLLGGLSLAFAAYLVPGLFPSERPKLPLLSGILPPVNVSFYHNEKDGLLGMHPEHDYFKAIELAKKENKPLLIDFTGYGCENCRKMEEFVWSQPDVLPLLQNEVVLASLYVDDKEELPAGMQTKIDMGGGQMKKIRTVGDRWSMFQQVNFNNNSQPHYVLVTPDGRVINTPVSGYMPKEDFKKFLECGVNWWKEKR